MIRPTTFAALTLLASLLPLSLSVFAQETVAPPTIEFVGNRSVEVTQTLGINVFAYSQSEEIPWLWAESLPKGADFFDSGEGFRTFLWYPGPAQVGQHTIKFIAADGRDQQIRTIREITITVTPGTFQSQAFSIVAPDSVDAFVGKQLSVLITATDSNGTVPQLTASPMPTGATLDDNGDGSRTFNWVPTSEQFGTYTIRFNAVSANFPNISTGHDMQIRVIGRAPLISFPVSPGVEVGEVLSFPISATKPSGAAASLMINPLPLNASFNDNGDGSRQFSWLTTDADIGTHTFLVTAVDPVTSLSSSINLYVNVLPDPSTTSTDQTIMLSSDLQSLEIDGATLTDPFDVSVGSIFASTGFLTMKVELLINDDATHIVELFPGINTIALESSASVQRTVLQIDRSPYPSFLAGPLPAAYAVDIDDKTLALSANVSPDERPVQNLVDLYNVVGSTLATDAYLGYETDFAHATSIDVSGNTLAVASREAPQAGVLIYERNNALWRLKTRVSPDTQQHPEGFGTVVALEGDTLAIAAVYDAGASPTEASLRGTPGAGAVLIYQKIGDEWQFQTLLKAPVPESNDYFGSSLALEGDTLVVGAIGEDSSGTGVDSDPKNNEYRDNESANHSAGAVFVYERVDDDWLPTAYLKPGDSPVPAMGFGHTVSVFENTIAVSALFATRTSESALATLNPERYGVGAVYLFNRRDSGWKQSAKLSPPANNWRFGLDIDLKENQLMVLTQARAYFYERHGDQWLLLWDENVGSDSVTFNHEAIVFGVINNDSLVYGSE